MSTSAFIIRLAEAPPAPPTVLRFVQGNGTGELRSGEVPSFSAALARLEERIRAGHIAQRDLKCRFDGCAVRESPTERAVEVRVGPTEYYAAISAIGQRGPTARKVARGEREGDPGRYLACGMGVVLLPYDRDGRVLLGARTNALYPGRIHGPGGWLPFEREVERIDPARHALTECEEELGLGEEALEAPELLGIVSYRETFETDFVFAARVAQGPFERLRADKGWRSARDADEHSGFVALSPAQALADDALRARLLPSTEFGLHALDARRRSACTAHPGSTP